MLNKKKNITRTSIFTAVKISKSIIKKIPLFVLALFLIVLLGYLVFVFSLKGKIYPGIYSAGIELSGITPVQASDILSKKIPHSENIILFSSQQKFEIPLKSINFSYDFDKTATNAYSLYRNGNFLLEIYSAIKSRGAKINIPLEFFLDEDLLRESLSVIAGQVAFPPTAPSATIVSGKAVVSPGKKGTDVDIKKLENDIKQALSYSKTLEITIPVFEVDPSLNDFEADRFKKRVEKLLGKSMEVKTEEITLEFNDAELIKTLEPKGGYVDDELKSLVDKVSEKFDRPPQNPVFVFEEGKVKEFTPSQEGLQTDKENLSFSLYDSLSKLENSGEKKGEITLNLKITPPDYKTEDVNNLGIKVLLGKGTSKFAGSIPTRIHNISLASSRFNGILVPPGQVFSFNNSLGDVSAYTGYKQAYVIKDGKTVLGDGGGVCQVSTTLFRAILDAGLPVVERRAHSYRVTYYEQGFPPGLDATVYAPTTDLKFKNDTPGHLLIQTIVDTKNVSLTFEIYGTSDGRVAKTTKPVVTDVSPPPEDLYVDDPALPAGETKQIDWKAWGAKVWFDYEVERDGEIIFEKTFYSNFRPWQAVFLRGTGPQI